MSKLPIWKMFNETARGYEEIDLDEAELLPGQTVMRLFWCESAQRYVTIPGASQYVVNKDGDVELSNE